MGRTAVTNVLVAVGAAAIACGGIGADPTTEPIPAEPTAATVPPVTPTLEQVPPVTPTLDPAPALEATPSPTSTRTAPPASLETPAPASTAQGPHFTKYSNDDLGFSFEYPADWRLDADNPVDLAIVDGAMTSEIRFGTWVYRAPPSLEEFTRRVHEAQAARWNGWQTDGQQTARIGGFPAIEARFQGVAEMGPMVGRIRTAVSGQLGFFLLTASRSSRADLLKPTFDAVANSVTLPKSGHRIPPPAVLSMVVTNSIGDGDLPTGGAVHTFEQAAPTLYALVQAAYVPIDSILEIRLLELDADGRETVRQLELRQQRVEVAASSGVRWDREGAWPVGFYRAVVTVDGDALADQVFTVIREEGNEFDDPRMYLTWARFLIADEDFERATYALSKAA